MISEGYLKLWDSPSTRLTEMPYVIPPLSHPYPFYAKIQLTVSTCELNDVTGSVKSVAVIIIYLIPQISHHPRP